MWHNLDDVKGYDTKVKDQQMYWTNIFSLMSSVAFKKICFKKVAFKN